MRFFWHIQYNMYIIYIYINILYYICSLCGNEVHNILYDVFGMILEYVHIGHEQTIFVSVLYKEFIYICICMLYV